MDSECGERTAVIRDGVWLQARCTEPADHPEESGHYDAAFLYGWLTVRAFSSLPSLTEAFVLLMFLLGVITGLIVHASITKK